MGPVPGREEENRGERGGLFDLLAASVFEPSGAGGHPSPPLQAASHPPQVTLMNIIDGDG